MSLPKCSNMKHLPLLIAHLSICCYNDLGTTCLALEWWPGCFPLASSIPVTMASFFALFRRLASRVIVFSEIQGDINSILLVIPGAGYGWFRTLAKNLCYSVKDAWGLVSPQAHRLGA
jgi:hypothetical protein